VRSRTTVKLVPRHTLALSGDESTSEGAAKKHGRRLPYVSSVLRSFRMPCSGRTAPVPHSWPCQDLRRSEIGAYRPADGAEEDGVSGFGGVKRFVGDGRAQLVDRAAAHEVVLEVELEVGPCRLDGLEHLDALGHDLRAAVVAVS